MSAWVYGALAVVLWWADVPIAVLVGRWSRVDEDALVYGLAVVALVYVVTQWRTETE